jgi:hypothetical protein
MGAAGAGQGLAAAAERLRGRPGRPRTRVERPPAPVVQVNAVVPVPRRLFDRQGSADYMSISLDVVDQLDAAGVLRRVRLPNGSGGDLKRVLYDRADLDRLIEQSKDPAP